MPDSWTLFNLAAALALSWTAVGLFTELAQARGIMAMPGSRQSHERPTPTGGGLGLVTAVLLVSVMPGLHGWFSPAWVFGLLPGFVLLGIVGWLDDRKPIPAWRRLFVQVAVSIALIAYLRYAGGAWNTLFAVSTVLALVWIMNAYNFMDGSNGMAGAQGLFSGLVLASLYLRSDTPGLAAPCLALSGACAGFLPWNIPQPRVFMGDAGSVPLGFAFGGLLVLGAMTGTVSWPAALLVLAVFLVDSTLTLAFRVLRRERWYTAHKQHAYQKLLLRGWSHNQVLALYLAINVFLVLPAILAGMMYPNLAWAMTGSVYALLVIAWCAGSLKHGGRT